MDTFKPAEPHSYEAMSLDSLRWFPNVVAQSHILKGVAHPGGYDPKFELGQDFCTMHLPPEVSSSYVYSFGSYCVDKHTHKQTDAAENIQRSSLRYDVG